MHNDSTSATRRDFLQTAAGSTLAALATSSLTPRLFAAGSDEIRLGLIGCGGRGGGAAANALALGVPKLELIEGRVPGALKGLAAPDAVFIGGGLSRETFEAAWAALRPLGRMVCNAVTLESEALLLELHKEHGGQLVKLMVNRAEPVGGLTGWRPLMPVTQWSLVKR